MRLWYCPRADCGYSFIAWSGMCWQGHWAEQEQTPMNEVIIAWLRGVSVGLCRRHSPDSRCNYCRDKPEPWEITDEPEVDIREETQ